jgi:hypothetical protein
MPRGKPRLHAEIRVYLRAGTAQISACSIYPARAPSRDCTQRSESIYVQARRRYLRAVYILHVHRAETARRQACHGRDLHHLSRYRHDPGHDSERDSDPEANLKASSESTPSFPSPRRRFRVHAVVPESTPSFPAPRRAPDPALGFRGDPGPGPRPPSRPATGPPACARASTGRWRSKRGAFKRK